MSSKIIGGIVLIISILKYLLDFVKKNKHQLLIESNIRNVVRSLGSELRDTFDIVLERSASCIVDDAFFKNNLLLLSEKIRNNEYIDFSSEWNNVLMINQIDFREDILNMFNELTYSILNNEEELKMSIIKELVEYLNEDIKERTIRFNKEKSIRNKMCLSFVLGIIILMI